MLAKEQSGRNSDEMEVLIKPAPGNIYITRNFASRTTSNGKDSQGSFLARNRNSYFRRHCVHFTCGAYRKGIGVLCQRALYNALARTAPIYTEIKAALPRRSQTWVEPSAILPTNEHSDITPRVQLDMKYVGKLCMCVTLSNTIGENGV